MFNLMRLDNIIVNLNHVTQVEFTPAYPGGDPNEEHPGQLTRPRPAVLTLTLTSVQLDTKEYDYTHFTAVGASTAECVKVKGELAERAWAWLSGHADGWEMVNYFRFAAKEA